MMSLGYVSNGGSSSSSSNLSPLAPPFTVDRSNSKPNSNQLSHFTEPPYALNNWSYPHSSPPRSDFVVDSVRTSSMPAETDYSFVGSESVNPQTTRWSPSNPGLKATSDWSALSPVNPQTAHWSPMNPGVKSSSVWSASNPNPSGAIDSLSYLGEAKPYYSPYVGSEDVPLVAPNEPSYDLLSTSGLSPPLVDGSSQVDYTQTLSGLEYAPQWEGIWSGGMSEANRGKRMEADDSFFSLESNMAGSVVYKNYMKPDALANESLNKGQEDSALSSGNYPDFIGRENRTGHPVAGKLDSKLLPVKTHSYAPVDFSNAPSSRDYLTFPEARLQGPTVEPLKEPWAYQNPYTIYEKRFQMFDAGKTDITSAAKTSPSVIIKPPAVSTTVSGPGKGSSKKEVSSQIIRNDQHPFVSPYARKEEGLRLNNVLGKSDLDHGSKARSGFQLPDINIPDIESIETVKSEDSPCWKGAGPAYLVSPFANIDDATLQLPTKKLQASDGMIFRATSINHPSSSSSKVPSGELCEKTMPNENVCEDNGFVVSPKKTAAVKSLNSTGHGLLSESNIDFESKFSHTQLPSIKVDASQVGTLEHVVHTNNSVPVSDQEDAARPATMNVQLLVKSMHDLSALLLFHCSNDANTLKEKDHLALDHVISNLDACLSRKIVQVTSKQDSVFPQLGNSNEGAYAGISQVTNEACASSHGRVNAHCASDEKGNHYLTGNKFENLQGLLSLRDDGDVSKEHNMVQAIKKILDENLECEVAFQSQTLMYKNLWLEAEAELCSVSYRARFERMKREMEKCKSIKTKDISKNDVASEKLSSPKISPDLNSTQKLNPEVNVCVIPCTSIQDSPFSSDNRVDDAEASVMARFNILKRRGEPIAVSGEEQQESKGFDLALGPRLHHQNVTEVNVDPIPSTSVRDCPVSSNNRVDDVETSVMARFNILKHRGEPIAVSGEEQQEFKSFNVAVGPGLRYQNATEVKVDANSSTFQYSPVFSSNSHLEEAETPVMANILKRLGEPIAGSREEQQDIKSFDVAVGPRLRYHTSDDSAAMLSRGASGASWTQNQVGSGWYNSPYSSSDWEHVLKDELAWRSDGVDS